MMGHHLSLANSDSDELGAIKGSSSLVPETHERPLFLLISAWQGTLPEVRMMVTAARRALLLLGCTAILQVTDTRSLLYCPEGWSYYKLSCFRYFRQLRTWDEAEAQCQSSHSGAHLVWVEEPKEAATLRRVISYYQRSQPVWFGLHHLQQSKSWQWTNGAEYDDSSKLPGNGAQGGECALLTQTSSFSVWSSADCKRLHHFICKFTPLQ